MGPCMVQAAVACCSHHCWIGHEWGLGNGRCGAMALSAAAPCTPRDAPLAPDDSDSSGCAPRSQRKPTEALPARKPAREDSPGWPAAPRLAQAHCISAILASSPIISPCVTCQPPPPPIPRLQLRRLQAASNQRVIACVLQGKLDINFLYQVTVLGRTQAARPCAPTSRRSAISPARPSSRPHADRPSSRSRLRSTRCILGSP